MKLDYSVWLLVRETRRHFLFLLSNNVFLFVPWCVFWDTNPSPPAQSLWFRWGWSQASTPLVDTWPQPVQSEHSISFPWRNGSDQWHLTPGSSPEPNWDFLYLVRLLYANIRKNYKIAVAGYQCGLHEGKDLRMKPRQKEEELQSRKANW